MNGYAHTQKGIVQPICLVTAAALVLVAALARRAPGLMPGMLFGAGILAALSFAFAHLRVRDDGDRLRVAFGPLVLFRKSIPYAEITGVEKARSTFWNGWGIHRTGKGWLWNIGGYDCVWIRMGDKATLIGTDDPDGLAAFLEARIAAGGTAGGSPSGL